MRWWRLLTTAGVIAGFLFAVESREQESKQSEAGRSYLGFDRNDYPGDAGMAILRKTLSFAGYWLSPPPQTKTNSWTGKRATLASEGFGFLLLYAGRPGTTLRSAQTAIAAGEADGKKAAETARKEGFAEGSIIFLDVEDGGRFNEAGHAYFLAWTDTLAREHFLPGFYCSGIVVDEGGGSRIISADDIRQHLGSRDAFFWVFNDACPPSPGCVSPQSLPEPSTSGVAYAAVWQIARSPREKPIAAHCAGYAKDGNCYAAGDQGRKWNLDLDVATSANPSAPQK